MQEPSCGALQARMRMRQALVDPAGSGHPGCGDRAIFAAAAPDKPDLAFVEIGRDEARIGRGTGVPIAAGRHAFGLAAVGSDDVKPLVGLSVKASAIRMPSRSTVPWGSALHFSRYPIEVYHVHQG